MIEDKLTSGQKIFLQQSAEFQKLLAEDPVLAELESQQYDPAAAFYALIEMLRGTFTIGRVEIQPLTPAVWAFLWGIGNRYTVDTKKVTEVDTDIFLYVLANGVRNLDCKPEELPAIASGFCPGKGIEYPDAFKEIHAVINAAFRPFEMTPKVKAGNSAPPPQYDAFWLAQLCSVVAQETNETANAIMFNMPLSACNYFFVNYIRKNDPKSNIRRRSPEEIQEEIFKRVNRLAEDFCKLNYTGE